MTNYQFILNCKSTESNLESEILRNKNMVFRLQQLIRQVLFGIDYNTVVMREACLG